MRPTQKTPSKSHAFPPSASRGSSPRGGLPSVIPSRLASRTFSRHSLRHRAPRALHRPMQNRFIPGVMPVQSQFNLALRAVCQSQFNLALRAVCKMCAVIPHNLGKGGPLARLPLHPSRLMAWTSGSPARRSLGVGRSLAAPAKRVAISSPLRGASMLPRVPHGQPCADWMPPASCRWTTRREMSLSLHPSTKRRIAPL